MTRWSSSTRKLQRALMTTQFDGAAQGSAKASWALIAQQAKADRFGCATSYEESSPFQRVAPGRSQKPDRYWYAPPRGQKPAISGTLTGYVRRSEFTTLPARAKIRLSRIQFPFVVQHPADSLSQRSQVGGQLAARSLRALGDSSTIGARRVQILAFAFIKRYCPTAKEVFDGNQQRYGGDDIHS